MGKVRKYGKHKPWTEKDVERLVDLRNKYTKSDLARILKRSPSAISNKVCELELGGLMDNTDRWTFTQITEAVGLSSGVVNKTWVKHGLKFTRRGNYCLVKESDLLDFMKTHTDLWTATKCDYYLFYQYPWFLQKLEQDKQIPFEQRKHYWTDYQKRQFELLARKGYTHQQIADAIGKTKRAVDHMSWRMAVKIQNK